MNKKPYKGCLYVPLDPLDPLHPSTLDLRPWTPQLTKYTVIHIFAEKFRRIDLVLPR